MLTEKQMNTVTKCIETGQGTQFDFEDATLCEVINEIIEHLQSQQMEAMLFGLPMTKGHVESAPEFESPEAAQTAFVHHAMHWAFQLGVGAALHAVNMDRKGPTVGEGQ